MQLWIDYRILYDKNSDTIKLNIVCKNYEIYLTKVCANFLKNMDKVVSFYYISSFKYFWRYISLS